MSTMSDATKAALASLARYVASLATYPVSGVKSLTKPRTPSSSILPFLPNPIKYALLLLLLINVRSFPLGWHFRVWQHAIKLRLKWRSMIGQSQEAKAKWIDSVCPIGNDPIKTMSSYKTWASPDDCDFYQHLSNSSYAKTWDCARAKYAMEYLLPFYREGGWIGVAATNYCFIKEIPLFASYEIRTSAISWDSKWVYVVGRFVTPPKKERRKKSSSTSTAGNGVTEPEHKKVAELKQSLVNASLSAASTSNPSLTPFSFPHTTTLTPGTLTPSKLHTKPSGSTTPNPLLPTTESDGSTIHCICLAQIVFKIDRITVPPALVLASSGFGLNAGQWENVKKMRARGEMGKFFRGGWRDVRGSKERWWEVALADVEERRAENLQWAVKVREGMDGLRAI